MPLSPLLAPRTVHWRRLDHPAIEEATFEPAEGRVAGVAWVVRGTVSGVLPDSRAYDATYRIRCGADWVTRDAEIAIAIGSADVRILLERDPQTGRWLRDRSVARQVAGCADVDLGFTPSTNSLPMRRLDLPVGESAVVRAAWLRFPELDIEPLEQTYTRLAPDRWRFESTDVRGERFEAELEVDDAGIVRRYGALWEPIDDRGVR